MQLSHATPPHLSSAFTHIHAHDHHAHDHHHTQLPSLQVFILPTIRINSVQYRGKMATAEVLRAICAGFAAGNTPETCSKVGAGRWWGGWGRGRQRQQAEWEDGEGAAGWGRPARALRRSPSPAACRHTPAGTTAYLPAFFLSILPPPAGRGRSLHAGRQGLPGVLCPHRRQDAGELRTPAPRRTPAAAECGVPCLSGLLPTVPCCHRFSTPRPPRRTPPRPPRSPRARGR